MSRSRGAALLLLVALSATAACRQDMHDQPKVKPFGASRFYADGRASRDPVPGTVARGQLRADADLLTTGLGPDGKPSGETPFPITADVLRRGRQRFDIYCSPCHGRLGDGSGPIVRRGFRRPTSLHAERLRAMPIGYFVDVATKGFGVMAPYASQVPPDDRWAIAAYIRALQLSQSAPADVLSPADVASFGAGAAAAPTEGSGH